MSAFTERLAARRAAMAIETERVTLALAAHRAAAQEANYREYCYTHRYDPRPAGGWTAEQVATMQATQRANTEAQNRTAAAVRDGCQCEDAMGHLVTDPADTMVDAIPVIRYVRPARPSGQHHCAWSSCSRLFTPTSWTYTYCGRPDCPATRVVPEHAQPSGTDIRA